MQEVNIFQAVVDLKDSTVGANTELKHYLHSTRYVYLIDIILTQHYLGNCTLIDNNNCITIQRNVGMAARCSG